MKPARHRPLRFRPGFPGAVVLGVIHLAVPVVQAAEWNAGQAGFGTASNWSDGNVPAGPTTGVLISNGGTATIGPEGSFTVGRLMLGDHAGVGVISQSGGCLNAGDLILGGDDAGGGTGRGTYSIAEGTLKAVAGEIWIGSKGGEGVMELSGNSLVASDRWVVIGRDGASGRLSLTGSSRLEVKSGNLPIGCNSNGFTSTMDVGESARVDAAGEIWVGWLGNNSNQGIMNLSGNAVVKTGGGFVVGRGGAKGSLGVSGDASLEAGGYMICGADPGGNGTLVLSGDARVHAEKQVWLGFSGSTGHIVVEAGCLTAHAVTGEDPSGAGIAFWNDGSMEIRGGVVSTPGFIKHGGSARLAFDGGALKASGTTSGGGFFVNFDSADLWIGPRGLTFDTNSQAVEVDQSLAGDGPLVKSGKGSLVLKGNSGYAGDTTISEGTLVLEAPTLSDSHRVEISGSGSRLRLAHGQLDRVAKLVIDGVVQPPGRYEAPGNPGAGTEIGGLEGSGALEVRFGPQDLLFSEWIAAHPPASGFDVDSDGDGLANGVEQIFGSDPNAFTPPARFQLSGDGLATIQHDLAPIVAADVSIGYEWSCDLADWHRSGERDANGVGVEITTNSVGNHAEAIYRVISGSPEKLFGRMKASHIPAP